MLLNMNIDIRYKHPNIQGACFMNNKDKVWFNTAKELSTLSDYRKMHVGCVAVYRHRIISTGYNSNKTDPLQKKINSNRFVERRNKMCVHSVHAEVQCLKPLITSSFNDFEKVKLYICRSTNQGIGLSRPCCSCYKLVKTLGIRWIYYTGYNGLLYKENALTEQVYLLKSR